MLELFEGVNLRKSNEVQMFTGGGMVNWNWN